MAEMPDPVRRLCEMAEAAADCVYVLTNLASPPGSRPKNLDNAISAVREHYAKAESETDEDPEWESLAPREQWPSDSLMDAAKNLIWAADVGVRPDGAEMRRWIDRLRAAVGANAIATAANWCGKHQRAHPAANCEREANDTPGGGREEGADG